MTGGAEQIQVSSGDLIAHAGQIDGIGDELAHAQQAGSAVRVDTAAYGQLCQFVPALLSALQDQMINGIAAAATSAHDTADALRSAAADYDAADRRAAARIQNTR